LQKLCHRLRQRHIYILRLLLQLANTLPPAFLLGYHGGLKRHGQPHIVTPSGDTDSHLAHLTPNPPVASRAGLTHLNTHQSVSPLTHTA
jgi:hypothetical protein